MNQHNPYIRKKRMRQLNRKMNVQATDVTIPKQTLGTVCKFPSSSTPKNLMENPEPCKTKKEVV
jgi:hypothetical protein